MVNLSGSKWAPASYRTPQYDKNKNFNTTTSTSTNNNDIYNSAYQQTSNTFSSPLRPPSPIKAVHALPPPPLTKPQRDLLTRHSALQRFHKLLRRLKWKSRALLFSHHRALSPHERQANVVGTAVFPMAQQNPETGGSGEAEAETMFKIDFFEFYVLLERVLVHLLGACGYVVTAVAAVNDARVDDDGLRSREAAKQQHSDLEVADRKNEPKSLREELLEKKGLLGDSVMFHGYAHRFHANVLAALDLETNPLHGILGIGVVRDYLGIAKEFRNRWKDVEEDDPRHIEDGRLVGSRYEKMLTDLKLEEMLSAILVAVENARPLAERELDRFAGTVGTGGGFKEAMMELDEAVEADAPWEAMPDAMDWD